MMWQRGFLMAYGSNQVFKSANIYFVHAQGPGGGMATDCWGGCCSHCPKLPPMTQLTKEFCNKYATGNKKKYYATCEDWDSNKCHK